MFGGSAATLVILTLTAVIIEDGLPERDPEGACELARAGSVDDPAPTPDAGDVSEDKVEPSCGHHAAAGS